jgi:hypothetical protein
VLNLIPIIGCRLIGDGGGVELSDLTVLAGEIQQRLSA